MAPSPPEHEPPDDDAPTGPTGPVPSERGSGRPQPADDATEPVEGPVDWGDEDPWDWADGDDEDDDPDAADGRDHGDEDEDDEDDPGEHEDGGDAETGTPREPGSAPATVGSRVAAVVRDLGERVAPDERHAAGRSGRTADGACRRCGAHVGVADRFCASCGVSLRAGAPGASRGGVLAPRLLRLGLPALVGAAVVVLLALLLRDPLAGVRSDLGEALEPPQSASVALTRSLDALGAGGSAATVRRDAEALDDRAREARRSVDELGAPAEAAGDVRRATDALLAQQRWARAVGEAVEDPRGDAEEVGTRAAAARDALGELDGLIDVDEARRAVGGTGALESALASRRRRASEVRRRERAAAERVEAIERRLRASAEVSGEQRDARTRLQEIAEGEDDEESADGTDADPAAELTELRTTLQSAQGARTTQAQAAADLDVPAQVEESREALEAAYRALGAEAGATARCLLQQGTFSPQSTAETCRSQTADQRAAAVRAQDAFARAYGPLRRAAGRDARPRP